MDLYNFVGYHPGPSLPASRYVKIEKVHTYHILCSGTGYVSGVLPAECLSMTQNK